MRKHGTTKESIDYKTFLKYIKVLRKNNITPSSLQGYIQNLNVYFDYLKQENYRVDNPIENLRIKGIVKRVLKGLLDENELSDLYFSYPIHNKTLSQKRDKIIVGLLVYQGLQTKELQYLKVENIAKYKGTIDIPATSKTQGRTLLLHTWQVLDILEYIEEYLPAEQEFLFVTKHGNTNLTSVLRNINKKLKRINFSYQNMFQLRSSVIVNWLQTKNLRQVQYLAGHRYISSTERYKQEDLEKTKDMIAKFHPIQ